jgi:thioester reductase-like protein
VILLTGATGFLGMELLARLLEDSDREVITVIRADSDAEAAARLWSVLEGLYEGPSSAQLARIRPVAGDVTLPGIGLSPGARRLILERTAAIVHCAASISFDLPLHEALEINAAGTSRVLDLAEEVRGARGLEQLVHVSTAYVAGHHDGVFGEDDLDMGQDFRNSYEESKLRAEQLVAAAPLPTTIVRPSIVVGASESGWTAAFNVLYWPLQAFARGLLDHVPARLDGVVDVVPVDYVARAIAHVLTLRAAQGTLHLVAGEHAATVDELMTLGATALGRPRPRLLTDASAMRMNEARIYVPYFDVRTRFDATRTREVLSPAGLEPPPLARYFDALIAYAQATRWGKRPVTREAAALAATERSTGCVSTQLRSG